MYRDPVREALETLADAAATVGVTFFDTDTMEPAVAAMQSATIAASAALAAPSAVEELVSGLRQFVECSPCQNGCAPSDMTCATRRAEFLIAKYGAAP